MSDTIVVSGISGRFPESDNIEELWHNLMSGVELSSTDGRRWPNDVFDLPKRNGTIKNIEKFDAEFFGISNEDANYMDPQIRLLHEATWEAIFDAGLDPNELRGSKTGVHIGACFCDTGLALLEKGVDVTDYVQFMTGRISYAFDFRGPVLMVDTACASSFSAFNEACIALKKRLCDNMIVCGLSVTLNPAVSFGFKKMKMISDDGRSKCLDAGVDGYCRSEAVVSLFLQRGENAKRIYASVVNVRTNTDGYKQEGITFPSSEAQHKLMSETIKEANIDPNNVNYIEAHMTGTAAGDPAESKAIVDSYRPNSSEKPLHFGCLKSNVGHTEGSSGCFALTKVCLALQKRCLPPNLHYKSPNPNIEALMNGIIKPVNEACKFNEDIVSANSFGFGGVNVHVILKANEKSVFQNCDTDANVLKQSVNTEIPRIIAVSGRNTETVEYMFDWMQENRSELTNDFLTLLNDVSKFPPERGFNGRGYLVFDENGFKQRSINHITEKKIWVLNFSSETLQNKSSLKHLLKLKPFKESISFAAEVLRKLDFDLWSCLTKNSQFETLSEQILITILTQIAVVDTIKYIGFKTDQIIADTIGKISGDYYDNCLTAKEAILLAFLMSKYLKTINNVSQDIHKDIDGMNDIFKKSKRRSIKWVNGLANSVCSLDTYLNKNEENIEDFVPKQALVVEINAKKITLESLFSTLGDVYNAGHNLTFEKFYPKAKYPVARETASLSHLWRWNHTQKRLVTKYPDYFCSMKSSKKFNVDLSDPFWRSLDGHCIDKRLLFPATGYLWLIWCTVVTSFDNLEFILNFSIEFKNVKFKRATMVPKIGTLGFVIHYIQETGDFEIMEGGSVCVTGQAKQTTNSFTDDFDVEPAEDPNAITLTTKEIYRELRTRGYDYGPNFRCLVEAKSDGSFAKAKWNGNWINLTDSVLQLSILGQSDRCLFLPTSIEYLKVNSDFFRKVTESKAGSDAILDVKSINRNYSVANGAMIIKNVIGTPTPRKLQDQTPDLEYIRFTPLNEIVSVSKMKMKKVSDYEAMCDKAFDLFSKSKMSGCILEEDEQVKNYLNKTTDETTLLKLLHDMLHENSSFENGIMEKYKNELSKDILLNLTKYDTLRPFVDLVFENVFTKTLNVVECNLSTNFLHDYLEEESKRNYANINYKLLHRLPINTSNVPSSCMHLWNEELDVSSIASDVDLLIWRDSSTSLFIKNNREVFNLKSFVDSSYETLKTGGFLLLNFRQHLFSIEQRILKYQCIQNAQLFTLKEVTEMLKESKFAVIGHRIDELGNVAILMRKLAEQQPIENQTVVDLKTFQYEWIEEVKKIVKENKYEKLWLRAADCDYNGVIGFFNCLKREIGENKLRCIFGENVNLTQEIVNKDLATNVFKNGLWGSMRNMDIDFNEQQKGTKYAYLDVQTKGDLSSLKWHESPLKVEDKNENETVCNVAYAALNFKDVMVASGKVPMNAYPQSFQNFASVGMEYSGVDENDNRICGICEGGAIASKVKINNYVWTIPNHWTLEEAATVPTVYVTVYFALLIRAKMHRNESILIHAGSGGVGQAAIAVCLKMNCNVFTTVGSDEKKKFLLKKFPDLKECQIGNSRDVSFEEMVMKQTNGKGVDIVLNSLAEEKLRASISCLADFGRFVEIGKYDLIINSKLEPYALERNITFHVVCVAHLIDEVASNFDQRKGLFYQLHSMVDKGMRSGEIQPLERHVFEREQSEEALRFMANGKHIGKVLIKINGEESESVSKIIAFPKTYFDSQKSYILIGGLGGFGLEVAYWMVKRGAKKLVVTSRSGIRENYQQYAIRRLQSNGTQVVVLKNDATNESKVLSLLKESKSLGEIGGIFIMSLILKDNLVEEQTIDDFSEVCSCKVTTTTLVDSMTRKMEMKLDYFVCFSSMVASIGNRTQTNYAFANSVMDRICEKRKADGLQGLSIQWGIIGDVGFVAERFEDKDLVLRGSVAQRIPSCLETLDKLMQTEHPVCLSMVRVKDSNKSTGKDDLKKQICHVLGIKNPDKVNLLSTLGELGLDSLMAVEIKQTLERDYELELSILEIRNLTLKRLMEIDNSDSAKKKTTKKSDSTTTNVWDVMLSVPTTTFVNLNNHTDGLPLFYLPPIDGHFNLMMPLTNFSRPVIGLNWTAELDEMSSISEIASFYAEQLYKTYPQREYEMIAYSFGSAIALELSVQLQIKYGQSIVKKLMLLDGSPKMLKLQTEDIYTSAKEGDETENFWDHFGFNLNIQNADRIKLRNDIHALNTKEEKTQKLAQIISEETGKECNEKLLMSAVQRYSHKSILIYSHTQTRKFVGKVTLVKAKGTSLIYNLKTIEEEDYGLSEVIDGNIRVITLQGNHENFIEENKSKIIAQIEDEFTFFAA